MSHQQAGASRRVRIWRSLGIMFGVLVLLIGGGFFVAEHLARDTAANLVSTKVVTALGATHPVDVDFGPGFVLVQAASGRLDSVAVSTDDLALGPVTGDLTLHATGIPLDTTTSVSSLSATVSLDESSVQALVASALVGGSLSFIGHDAHVAASANVLGNPVPVELSLTPSVAAGTLSFDLTAITVDGTDVAVDDVRSGKYGAGVAALATAPSVCVAQFLPAALSLSAAKITGGELVLSFSAHDVALSGASFTTKGSCG